MRYVALCTIHVPSGTETRDGKKVNKRDGKIAPKTVFTPEQYNFTAAHIQELVDKGAIARFVSEPEPEPVKG